MSVKANQVHRLLALICLGLLLATAAAENQAEFSDLFKQWPNGCVVVFNDKTGNWHRQGEKLSDKRSLPASTFKVLHSLIALETGVVDGKEHFKKWDGRKRVVGSWNRDHVLQTAFANSVVWYFEEVAREIGPVRLQDWVVKCNYGNRDTSGTFPFWLEGNLAISPNEQVAFLRKLRAGQLPFEAEHQQTVKEMMLLESGPGWVLRGKTGWAQTGSLNIGWYVGWVEREDATFFFATNLQSTRSEGFSAARKSITHSVLRRLGAID